MPNVIGPPNVARGSLNAVHPLIQIRSLLQLHALTHRSKFIYQTNFMHSFKFIQVFATSSLQAHSRTDHIGTTHGHQAGIHIARGPTTAPASASSAGLSSLGGSSSGGQGAGKASATSFPSSGGGSSFGGSSSPFAGSSSFGSSSGGGGAGSFTFSRDAYGRLKGHYKQRLGNGESYKAFKKLLRATQEAVGKLGRTTEIYGEKSGAPAHAVAKSEVSNALRKMTGVLIRSRSLADAFGALLPNDALKAQWRSMQL